MNIRIETKRMNVAFMLLKIRRDKGIDSFHSPSVLTNLIGVLKEMNNSTINVTNETLERHKYVYCFKFS